MLKEAEPPSTSPTCCHLHTERKREEGLERERHRENGRGIDTEQCKQINNYRGLLASSCFSFSFYGFNRVPHTHAHTRSQSPSCICQHIVVVVAFLMLLCYFVLSMEKRNTRWSLLIFDLFAHTTYSKKIKAECTSFSSLSIAAQYVVWLDKTYTTDCSGAGGGGENISTYAIFQYQNKHIYVKMLMHNFCAPNDKTNKKAINSLSRKTFLMLSLMMIVDDRRSLQIYIHLFAVTVDLARLALQFHFAYLDFLYAIITDHQNWGYKVTNINICIGS